MTDTAKDAIDRLETFLRAVAPGFVALGFLALAEVGHGNRVLTFFREMEVLAVGVGVLLGLVSYSLHYALFEDWFMRLVILDLGRSHPEDIPKLMPAKATDIIPYLSRERWARSVSENKKTVALQAALGRSYSWFIFLYCSGYLVVAGALWSLLTGGSTPFRALLVLAIGVWFVLSAVTADTKATRHELWLCRNYPQFAPTTEERPNKALESTTTAHL